MKSLAIFLVLIFSTSIASAGTLPKAEGRPLVTFSGTVGATNTEHGAVLDRALLETLPFVDVKTETPWTEGMVTFTGPRLRDVLAMVGATGSTLYASAVNDYTVTLPSGDAETYDVIIALEQNGLPLSRRDKGPAWIIYPLSDHPELNNSDTLSKMIWQLTAVAVQE